MNRFIILLVILLTLPAFFAFDAFIRSAFPSAGHRTVIVPLFMVIIVSLYGLTMSVLPRRTRKKIDRLLNGKRDGFKNKHDKHDDVA
jgi:hypothetical protein